MSSPPGTGRTILSVIGPHSGCGKTLFVSWLLRHVEGLGCLKISPTHDGPEGVPAGDKSSGIRRQDFQLEDSALLNRPGKDTALYLRIGAVRVERLRPRGDGLARGLRAALQRFDRSTPIVVESSRSAATGSGGHGGPPAGARNETGHQRCPLLGDRLVDQCF